MFGFIGGIDKKSALEPSLRAETAFLGLNLCYHIPCQSRCCYDCVFNVMDKRMCYKTRNDELIFVPWCKKQFHCKDCFTVWSGELQMLFDCDHADKKDKWREIADLRYCSMKSLAVELEKCVLRCKLCHVMKSRIEMKIEDETVDFKQSMSVDLVLKHLGPEIAANYMKRKEQNLTIIDLTPTSALLSFGC